RFLVSIDRIESLTGLDFFHELPDDVEQRLEAQVVRDGWQVDSFSRTPSRY
ncbi:MAG: endonuclease, partial [Cobetia sp.]|nr:endonuclease [Cobetia sp.]